MKTRQTVEAITNENGAEVYTHPSGNCVLTVDFADPEEREASFWVKSGVNATDYYEWINQAFAKYGVDFRDGGVVDTQEVDGGEISFLSF